MQHKLALVDMVSRGNWTVSSLCLVCRTSEFKAESDENKHEDEEE